jgi:hypothetical protein
MSMEGKNGYYDVKERGDFVVYEHIYLSFIQL